MCRVILSMCLFSLVGCTPKLNDERSFELVPGGDTKFIEIPPIKSDQKITVTASATGGPIDIYVFLNKHRAAIEAEVFAKKTEKVLAQSEKTESATLTATIPAREEAAIWIKPATVKAANVKLKITN